MEPIPYPDQTVLVTGASSGLGAEFSRRLAERGSDLVLVARRADRLQELASELTARYGTNVTVIPMDLARPGVGEELRTRLAQRDVAVTSLINNAGFATTGPFHETDPEKLRTEVALDVDAVVDVTRAFIDPLRVSGSGFLVNLASVAAYQPIPEMAVYAAAKAFVLTFSEALWAEAHGTGLRVLAVSPGPTDTEFFDVAGDGAAAGMKRMSPADVVDATLRALDRRNPPPSIVPGGANRALSVLGRLAPRRPLTRVLEVGMRRAADRSGND